MACSPGLVWSGLAKEGATLCLCPSKLLASLVRCLLKAASEKEEREICMLFFVFVCFGQMDSSVVHLDLHVCNAGKVWVVCVCV